MALTRDFNKAVYERIQSDTEYATGLFAEAMSALLEGEADVARLLLRDVINGTIGFEPLAEQVGIPSKSLHRMFSARGNPSMNNLSAIIEVIRRTLRLNLKVEKFDAAASEENGGPTAVAIESDFPVEAELAPDSYRLFERASDYWTGALAEPAVASVSPDTLKGIKAFTLIATFEKCLGTVLKCSSDIDSKNLDQRADRERRAVFVSSSELNHLARATESGIRALSKSLKVDLTLQHFPSLFKPVWRDIDLELDQQIKELSRTLERLTTAVQAASAKEDVSSVDERKARPCAFSHERLQQCTSQVQSLIRVLSVERAKHKPRS